MAYFSTAKNSGCSNILIPAVCVAYELWNRPTPSSNPMPGSQKYKLVWRADPNHSWAKPLLVASSRFTSAIWSRSDHNREFVWPSSRCGFTLSCIPVSGSTRHRAFAASNSVGKSKDWSPWRFVHSHRSNCSSAVAIFCPRSVAGALWCFPIIAANAVSGSRYSQCNMVVANVLQVHPTLSNLPTPNELICLLSIHHSSTICLLAFAKWLATTASAQRRATAIYFAVGTKNRGVIETQTLYGLGTSRMRPASISDISNSNAS